MTVARLALTALDCAEPEPLAEFWAALLDGKIVLRTEQVVVVKTDTILLGAGRRGAQAHAPRPRRAGPRRRGGSSAASRGPHGRRAAAGHPFCLTVSIPFDL